MDVENSHVLDELSVKVITCDVSNQTDVNNQADVSNQTDVKDVKDAGGRSIRELLMNERGSLSVVIIGLFFIVIACLVVMSNVATVLVAKRSLAQATEAAAQRGVHSLDKSAYYTGKGTMFTTPLAMITGRDHSPIPIDCNRAFLEVVLELRNWSNDDNSMKRHELQGIVLTNMECDGSSLEISTYSEVKFPFKVPFLKMDSAVLTSTVGTTNQVQEGFYLFGVRLH